MGIFQQAGIMVAHVTSGGTICKTMVRSILGKEMVPNKLLDLNNYILKAEC